MTSNMNLITNCSPQRGYHWLTIPSNSPHGPHYKEQQLYLYSMWTQHSSHQPLVMETDTVSGTSDINCTLSWLISWEDFIVDINICYIHFFHAVCFFLTHLFNDSCCQYQDYIMSMQSLVLNTTSAAAATKITITAITSVVLICYGAFLWFCVHCIKEVSP